MLRDAKMKYKNSKIMLDGSLFIVHTFVICKHDCHISCKGANFCPSASSAEFKILIMLRCQTAMSLPSTQIVN